MNKEGKSWIKTSRVKAEPFVYQNEKKKKSKQKTHYGNRKKTNRKKKAYSTYILHTVESTVQEFKKKLKSKFKLKLT